MSADRPTVPDEHLLRDLEAFAMTLEHQADNPISSPGSHGIEILPGSGSENSEERDRSAISWVAVTVAVVALIVGGFWVQQSGRPAELDQPAVPLAEDPDHDNTADDSTVISEDSIAAGFVPVGPTSILASDGTEIAVLELLEDSTTAIVSGVEGDGHLSYVHLVLGQLIEDSQLLSQSGWKTGMVDPDGNRLGQWQWLAQAGLEIETYLDPALTAVASGAVDDNISIIEDETYEFDYDTTVITIDPQTGAVPVYLSWPDRPLYWVVVESGDGAEPDVRAGSPLDPMAVQCCVRQPGSVMKPLVLATAFEQGFTPNDLISASGPCEFREPTANGIYRVNGRQTGDQSLASVTRSSNNCAFVRLGTVVGNDEVVETAAGLGLTTIPEQAGDFLSLPLGPVEVDWMEMTSAYATFAADGVRNKPTTLAEVRSAEGTVLWSHSPEPEQVLEREAARMVNEVLETVVRSGTGVGARIDGQVIAGKTGSTQTQTDAWFIGYTKNLATTVWVGDTNLFLGNQRPIILPDRNQVYGGQLPADIWKTYMESALAGHEPVPFPAPSLPDREPVTLISDAEVDS